MHDQAIKILEKQRQDLVVRVLKKHEEMEASRSFTERILAGISELFLLMDQDFRVIQTNREFLQRTGFALDDDRQLTLDDLVGPDKAEAIRQAFAKGEFTEFEAHLKNWQGFRPAGEDARLHPCQSEWSGAAHADLFRLQRIL